MLSCSSANRNQSDYLHDGRHSPLAWASQGHCVAQSSSLIQAPVLHRTRMWKRLGESLLAVLSRAANQVPTCKSWSMKAARVPGTYCGGGGNPCSSVSIAARAAAAAAAAAAFSLSLLVLSGSTPFSHKRPTGNAFKAGLQCLTNAPMLPWVQQSLGFKI